MSDVINRARDAIAAALYMDVENVHANSRLITDLGAESIDLLDVMFRLEKEFGVKLRQGEIESQIRGDMSDAEFATDGVLSEKALGRLREVLPEADQAAMVPGLTLRDIAPLFTVETFAKMVARQLPS
jgi:acyl carrier protein